MFGFLADAEGKILDKNKVICQLCQNKLGYSKNTSNLFYHLEKEHPIKYTTIKDKSVAVPTPKSEQPTIEMVLVSLVPYAKSNPRYKQLLNATVEFICYWLNPVSIVDDPSFRNLRTFGCQ